jgi:DHA2 family multidrug resistance protein
VAAKWLIMAGALIIAAGMYNSTNLNGDLNFGWFVWQRIYIGIGLPLIFIAITNASYDGIPKDKTDQASALINVARNTGGSIGVAIAQNVLMYREQFHQSRLVEHVVASNPAYQRTLALLTRFFESRGIGTVKAANQAFAAINQTVQHQVAFWAYIDVFVALGFVALSAAALALLMRPTKGGDKGEAA